MKKSIVLIFALCFLGIWTQLKAQLYNTGVGVRLGTTDGFTLKHFVSDINAIEGLITFNDDGFVLTGLYEYQMPINGATNLDWFVGGGGHLGSYYSDAMIIGIDFIGGLDYKFTNAPFSVSLDLNPSGNLIGHPDFFMGVGLSVRYCFK